MSDHCIPPPEYIQYTHAAQSIHLIRSRAAHAPALIEGINESLEALRAFMLWAHYENTVESQRERLAGLESEWDQNKDYTFSIFTSQEEGPLSFAGCIGMHLTCLSNKGIEIGYWIRSSAAGQGLCTLATQLLVYIGFEYQKMLRIKVVCDAGNGGSRRVIEKIGFPYEGKLRNGGYCDVSENVAHNGWQATGDLLIYGMIPVDYKQLSWVEVIREKISFEVQSNIVC